MEHTVGLVAAVVGLLLALEILNALFDSVCEALGKDMAKKQTPPVWAIPFVLLRWLLATITKIGTSTSLIMHEGAHATAQFAFGGKPRIALLKNGGYARSTPWSNAAPARIVHNLGGAAGLGVMCAAPILVGAALLVAVLVIATPMRAGDVIDVGRVLGADPGSAHHIASGLWHVIAVSHWWAYPILIVVPLLLAPGMTPSSVDYVYGSLHLLAYGVGAIVCTAVAQHSSHALWFVVFGAGIGGFIGVATPSLPDSVRRLLGGLGFGTSLIALAMVLSRNPIGALDTALGVLLFGLGIAAITYVAFVAVFLGLSLISIRPGTLWLALAGAPKHLIDLVRPFNTCETCRIHYRGTCDGCGRRPA